MNELLMIAIRAAYTAGDEIMKIYETGDFSVEFKADNSPLTIADKRAHHIIDGILQQTNIPVLSEEGRSIPYSERSQWSRLWVVDPIDGTKEFIKRNGEFTVNIALVENQESVLGVILVPVTGELYFSNIHQGAYKYSGIYDAGMSLDGLTAASDRLPATTSRSSYTVVGSKSHMTDETLTYIQSLCDQQGEIEFISKGSSLKLCMVAEGKADIYPRFSPTMEWDTAAGSAIIVGAGGTLIDYTTKAPMLYNRPDLLNQWFIASL